MVVNERIKLFTGSDAERVNAAVNDFLDNDPEVEYVRDITTSVGSDTYIVVTVFYEIEPAKCLKA
jgi:hypothetical protein